MRLPSKTTPYSRSIIAYFNKILMILSDSDVTALELYSRVDLPDKNLPDFLSALDCLFALGKIEIIEGGGLLKYVDRNTM